MAIFGPPIAAASLALRAAPMIGRGLRAGYGGVRGLLGRQGVMTPTQYSGNANFGVPSLLNSGRANVPALRPVPNVNASAGGNNFVNSLIGRINRANRRQKTALGAGAFALGGGANELRKMAFPGGSVASTVDSGGSARDRGAPTGDFGNIPPSERNLQAANQMQDMSPAKSSDEISENGEGGNGFLKNFSGLFSDNQRLAQIAMGAALLEGRPIEEAVAISDFIKTSGSGAGGDIDTVVIDRETNLPIAYGNKGDASIKNYAKEPNKFKIQDRDKEGERQDAIDLLTIELRQKSGAKFIDEQYDEIQGTNQNRELIENLISSLKTGDLQTGSYAELRTQLIKLTGETDKVKDEELLKSFNTFLTTQVAETVSGALSNQELELFSESQPGLSRGTETNIALLERKLTLLDIAQARIEYIADGLDNGERHQISGNEFDKKFKTDLDFKAEVLDANIINDVNAVIEAGELPPGRYYVSDVTSPDFGTYLTQD